MTKKLSFQELTETTRKVINEFKKEEVKRLIIKLPKNKLLMSWQISFILL